MSVTHDRPSKASPTESRRATGVLCPDCEHLNPIQLESCEHCSAGLWSNCPDCGARNRKVDPRCIKCSRRLLKGTTRRRSTDGTRAMKIWLVILVVGGLAFSVTVLHFLTNLSFPRLW